MWKQIFLIFLGLSSGAVIAGGVTGLLIGLAIVPRYAGITRTGRYVPLYEDVTLLGTVLGNLFFLEPSWNIPFGKISLLFYGLFSGIFLGGWILALAEIASVFPIFARRAKFTRGLPVIILCMALGKTLGALFGFFQGWT